MLPICNIQCEHAERCLSRNVLDATDVAEKSSLFNACNFVLVIESTTGVQSTAKSRRFTVILHMAVLCCVLLKQLVVPQFNT